MPPPLFLNEDVIAEILARLPAKEIARVRCVCKRWLSLTSDPHFIQYHSANNPHPSTSGFFLDDYFYGSKYFPLNVNPPGLPDPSLSFIPTTSNGTQLWIESSCNGLIICRQATRPPPYRSRHHSSRKWSKYYVCNPTTKEFIQLSIPNEVDRNFSLIFDPSKTSHYKVVSMGSQIHVYSSETHSWKLSVDKNSMREFGGFHHYPSVYWNGLLILWMGMECLLSFDTEGESIKKLPMLPEPHQCYRIAYMGSSGGKLQIIGRSKNERITCIFDILEMDSECSGWSVLYHVDLSPMLALYPEVERRSISTHRPHRREIRQTSLAFWQVQFIHGGRDRGAAGDDILLLGVPRKIISYNLKSKAFTEVCDVTLTQNTLPRHSSHGMYDWPKFHSMGHTLFSP